MGSKPASRRDHEDRAHLVPAVLGLVADAADHTVIFDQLPHPRPHHEPEARVPLRLLRDELEEARLGHDRDVRVLGLQAAEVDRREGARGGLQREVAQLGVAQLEQTVGKTQLVHDLHDRRVQRVTAELAVEVTDCLGRCFFGGSLCVDGHG